MSATAFAPSTLPAREGARSSTPARLRAAVEAAVPNVARPGWLERLALWADAQPQHHRLGSWTMGC
jgi:hypothetical protein